MQRLPGQLVARLAALSARQSSQYTTSTRCAAEAAREAVHGEPVEGPKTKLYRILQTFREPTPSEKVWVAAKEEGLKSKRFTKQMLAQMKAGGWVATKPLGTVGKRRHQFGYMVTTKPTPPQAGLSVGEKLRLKQAAAEQQGTAAAAAEAPADEPSRGLFSRLLQRTTST